MKNVLSAAVMLLVPLFAFGQTDTIPKTAVLNGNKIRAAVNSNGLLFHDLETGNGAFNHEDYPDIPLLKSVGFWAGGIDPGGNLKLAAMQPSEEGKRDFIPGYIDTETGQPKDFNYIASVSRLEIETHLQDLGDNGIIDFPIAAIYSWPGRGNSHFQAYTGIELPDYDYLAPFWDESGDNIYNPDDGDYPVTGVWNGCFDPQLIPDQLMWTTAHDFTTHTLSGADPIKITVQPTVFVFNCNLSDVYSSTVCVRYQIINHAQEDIDSMYFGINVDFDLGCPTDDYIGVSPDNRFVYAYNANEMDDDCGDFIGVGSNPPIVLADFVRGPLDENINQLNPLRSGLVFKNEADVFPPGIGKPTSKIEYYRYLSGSWRDGSPLEMGGDGYQEGTAPVDLPFIDNPNLPDGWSEKTSNNPVGDRNLIGTMGDFTLQPGVVNQVIIGFTVLQDLPFEDLYEFDLDNHLQEYYTGFCLYGDNCGQSATNTKSEFQDEQFKLYPNPTSNLLNIEFPNQKAPNALRILDFSGKELWKEKDATNNQTIQINWLPAGVYFLEGDFENGIVRKKFIVLKE